MDLPRRMQGTSEPGHKGDFENALVDVCPQGILLAVRQLAALIGWEVEE